MFVKLAKNQLCERVCPGTRDSNILRHSPCGKDNFHCCWIGFVCTLVFTCVCTLMCMCIMDGRIKIFQLEFEHFGSTEPHWFCGRGEPRWSSRKTLVNFLYCCDFQTMWEVHRFGISRRFEAEPPHLSIGPLLLVTLLLSHGSCISWTHFVCFLIGRGSVLWPFPAIGKMGI